MGGVFVEHDVKAYQISLLASIIPLILIYRKYYGTKAALYIIIEARGTLDAQMRTAN